MAKNFLTKNKEKKWIKNFGNQVSVLIIYALIKGMKDINQVYGLPNSLDYKYIAGEEFRTVDYLQKLNSIVRKDIKKWVKLIVNKLSLIVDEFETFCQEKKEYKTNLELYNGYKDFFKRFSHFLGVCDMPVFIEEAMAEEILKRLNKHKVKNIDRHFQILTTYLQNSYVNQEEEEILKIAVRVNRKKNLFLNNFKEFKKTVLYQEILNHCSKYSWIGFRLLLGKERTQGYFLKRIKENMSTAQKRLNEILARQKQNKELFEKTTSKLKLDKNLLQCSQLLMWIRDKRYVGITRGAFYKKDIFEKIAQAMEISNEDVVYLLPQEIRGALLKKKKIDKRLIKQRKKGYVFIVEDGRISKLITGKKLISLKKEKIKRVNELKGRGANPGYVTGIVRVVIHDRDLLKFKTNEILVTNMTTPDYVIAMKKAVAVVTDLGGITCHAAILSRELNIPCIIGTQIATRVLKTGDRIEVDANAGIVRILKK